jgi:hypothetical protein
MRKLTFLLLILLIVSCNKDKHHYPETYVFDSYETGTIRIFTNSGEIEDEQLAKHFFDTWTGCFYLADSFRFDDNIFYNKIILNEDGQATIETYDEVLPRLFKIIDGVIYFESTDTIYSTTSIENLKDDKFLYGPITQTNIIEGPGTAFPSYADNYYGYRDCVYALDRGDVIKFPFISFLEKYCFVDTADHSLVSCYNVSAFSNINNRFAVSYADRIIGRTVINGGYEYRDTIVVQENYAIFRKQ